MPFIIDEDEPDLSTLFQGVKVPEPNMYISDSSQAVRLLSELIRNEKQPPVHRIKSMVAQLFALFSEISLDNELELYEQFLNLCARLTEIQKIRKLQNKAVVSFGGKFSAGKSRFINAISGIQDLLPVDQKPTTSVPTYIIKADHDTLSANSIYGYSTPLTTQSMGALTHEFYDTYGIGFSAFLDCIIAESSSFILPEGIALLDTPGYTKYDENARCPAGEHLRRKGRTCLSKMTLSDRQRAFEQLRASDYLIWLVDIDNGGLNQDDLDFLASLHFQTKVLVVFTKADLKPEHEIHEILNLARQTMVRTAIPCFGGTAYSSPAPETTAPVAAKETEEDKPLMNQTGMPIVNAPVTYEMAAKSRHNKNFADLEFFQKLEDQLRQNLVRAIDTTGHTARDLFGGITRSRQVMQIRSLVELWGRTQQKYTQLRKLLKRYDNLVTQINHEIASYIQSEDQHG